MLHNWFEPHNVLLCVLPRRIWRLGGEWWRSGSSNPLGSVAGEAAGQAFEASPQGLMQRYPWLQDPHQESPTFSPQAFLEFERTRARICRPGEDALYQNLFEELQQMQQAAAPASLLVMLIPDEFQIEEDLWEILTAQDPQLDRTLPQRRIGAWLDRQGIPYLDLLPEFLSEAPLSDGKRHLYHLRDTHLNARGNRVAGKALARFLGFRL